MARDAINNKSLMLVLILFGFLLLFCGGMRLYAASVWQKTSAIKKITNEKLVLENGKMISLAGVKMKSPGEEGYEGSLFVLTEMLKNKDVWLEKANDGYIAWIGCVETWSGWPNCRKAIRVNEVLARSAEVGK